MPHISKMLYEPILWRLLGPVSSIAGLVTYAHSSTFRQLFGKWDFFGYLYATVSFIIVGIMLFAYKLRISSNFLLKAHLEFIVFTMISLYSFFYDKANIPNSDVLTLISCAAFSVMLLSLSRQIDGGFIVDLLNFFLGSFAIQLMKTEKIILTLVATAFCYSLILIRCYSDDSKHPIRTDQAQEQVAGKDLTENGVLKEVVNSRTEALFKILQIKKLEKGTVICEANLREAITAGFEKECCWVYGSWRRQILEEKLLIKGLRKLSIEEILKMPWNEVQDEIEKWIRASTSCLEILFYDERKLCDQFFAGLSHTMDQTFMLVCQASVIQLLDFANAIATGSRSTERLFKIVDMFVTLRSLMPQFETLFSDQYCVVLKNEAITTLKRLREAIKGIFVEFENMICQDTDKAPTMAPSPGVDPFTKYVMNYLDASCKSWEILEHVFEDTEVKLDEISVSSSLSAQMVRIVELLEINLEAKSKIYRDSALCSVFMMENWMYIVQISNDNQLGTLLGDDWVRKHTEKVQKYPELGLLNLGKVISESNTVAKSADWNLKMPKILHGSKGKLWKTLKRRVKL